MDYPPNQNVITLTDALKGRGSRVFKVFKAPKVSGIFKRVGRDYRN